MNPEELQNEAEPADDGVFSKADREELEELRLLRKDLVRMMTRDESGNLTLPDKTSDKVLLAQLLDGSERMIMTKARLKVASKTSDGLGNLADAVAKALKGFKPAASIASPSDRVIPGEYLHVETVPGEMDIGNLPMTMQEIGQDA